MNTSPNEPLPTRSSFVNNVSGSALYGVAQVEKNGHDKIKKYREAPKVRKALPAKSMSRMHKAGRARMLAINGSGEAINARTEAATAMVFWRLLSPKK